MRSLGDDVTVVTWVVQLAELATMLRLISSWSTNSKMCGALMRMDAVPVTVTARKMHSWSRSITIAM